MTRRKPKQDGDSRRALGHSPLAVAAAEPEHPVLPFPSYRGGGQAVKSRPASVTVTLPRSSAPRLLQGLSATAADAIRGRYAYADPLSPRHVLPYLYTLAVIHPAVSQAVKLLRANVNRGHSVVFDVPEGADALLDQLSLRLDAFASRVFPMGGIDGWFNSLASDLCIAGAVSSEDIIRPGVHVERVTSVPCYDVEFSIPEDSVTGEYVPWQRTGRGLMRLNDRTYSYLPWQVFGNNPTAIPPFIAALNDILRDEFTDDQIDAVLEKAGWFGLMMLTVPMRPEDTDDTGRDEDERFRERQAYLSQIATNLSGNFRKGITVADEGTKIDFQASPAQSMAGAADLRRMVEERIFSGLGLDPALFGRAWAKTETWLGVAKSILEDQASAFQRIIATRHEKTLALDCALGGYHVKPWVRFEPVPSQRPNEQAQSEQQRWATSLDRVINGQIDPTTAARENGYDEWFDPSRIPADSGFDIGTQWARVRDMVREGAISPEQGAAMLGLDAWADPSKIQVAAQPAVGGMGLGFRARFRHDRTANRYRFERPRVESASVLTMRRAQIASATVSYLRTQAPKSGKPRRHRHSTFASLPGGGVLQRMVKRFLDAYAGRLEPVLVELQGRLLDALRDAIKSAPEGKWRDGDEFATWAQSQLQSDFGRIYRERGLGDEVLDAAVKTHEEMAEAWRKEDRSAWASGKIPQVEGEPAVTAEDVSALARGDEYHVSIYLEGMSGAERESLQKLISEEFEQAGGNVYDRDTIDRLIARLERDGGLLLRRRDHGREGGADSETDQQARARIAPRIQRIVETSVMRSRNVAQIRNLREAEIDEYVIEQVGEAIEGEICTEMAGTVVAVADANDWLDEFLAMRPEDQEATLTEHRSLGADGLRRIPGAAQPPLHPHCFPGDVRVSGSFVAGVRMAYDGPLVTLQVDGLNPLRVTPNHPVLTPRGFVPAGEIRQGDHVLCDGAVLDDLALNGRARDDEHEPPSRIEDVFDALGAGGLVPGAVRRRVAPDALHGDARFGDGHVDVVGAERELLHDVGAKVAACLRERVLVVTAVAPCGLNAERLVPQGVGALATPSDDRPSRLALAADGRRVETKALPADPLRVGLTAQLDAEKPELTGERAAADAAFAREMQQRFAGRVTPRKVVESVRSDYKGHVYDLQSSVGYLSAEGILSSNCRCVISEAE